MILNLLLPLLFTPVFYFSFSPWWRFVLFVGGVYLGTILLLIDQLWLWRMYQDEPESQPNATVGTAETAEPPVMPPRHTFIITKSIFFALLYVPLALFIITSAGSAIGVGLILGIGLQLSFELLRVKRRGHDINELWTVGKQPLTDKEKLWLTRSLVGFFVMISILVWWRQ